MRLGDTPVPIPNTTVKTQAVDGTWWAAAWESRWSPESNFFFHVKSVMVGMAQLVSAPDCGSGGRGFESLRVHHIKNQQKCWFFLCSCGFSAFLTFANLAVSCGLFAYRLHRNYTVKCPLQLRRGYLFTTPSLTLQVPRTKGAFALCLRLERPYR